MCTFIHYLHEDRTSLRHFLPCQFSLLRIHTFPSSTCYVHALDCGSVPTYSSLHPSSGCSHCGFFLPLRHLMDSSCIVSFLLDLPAFCQRLFTTSMKRIREKHCYLSLSELFEVHAGYPTCTDPWTWGSEGKPPRRRLSISIKIQRCGGQLSDRVRLSALSLVEGRRETAAETDHNLGGGIREVEAARSSDLRKGDGDVQPLSTS